MSETPTKIALQALVDEQARVIQKLSLDLEMHTQYLEESLSVRDERYHAMQVKVLNQREQLRQLNMALLRKKDVIYRLRDDIEFLKSENEYLKNLVEQSSLQQA